MISKKEIILKYKKALKIIKKHNKNYYKNDKPEISDSEYDQIKKTAIDLKKKFSYLNSYENVENIIGTTPSNKFKKIQHLSPMLSLSNAFDINDMKEFIKKINNFLNQKNQKIELFCEPKIDGISATLIY